MSHFDPVAFVARYGIVLASARGPVPSVAEAIAGEPIRGSWWGHPRGHEIFSALRAIADSPDVLTFRLIQGKITFVHRRLWPALVRLADDLGPKRLAAIRQEHTPSGAHRNVITPYPNWVSDAVSRAARKLSISDAQEQLGALLSLERSRSPPARRRPRRNREERPPRRGTRGSG